MGICIAASLDILTGAKVIEDAQCGLRHGPGGDLAGGRGCPHRINTGWKSVFLKEDAGVIGFWIERRVVGSCVIVGAAAFMGLKMAQLSAPGFWQLAPSFLVVLVVSFLAYRSLIRPSVDCGRERIVVRNARTEYTVAWGRVRRFEWNEQSNRLSVVLTDGKWVCLEAFSVWPTLGRHDQVKNELEHLRRQAPGQMAPVPVSERPSAPWAGSLLTLVVVAALLALGVQGVTYLL